MVGGAREGAVEVQQQRHDGRALDARLAATPAAAAAAAAGRADERRRAGRAWRRRCREVVVEQRVLCAGASIAVAVAGRVVVVRLGGGHRAREELVEHEVADGALGRVAVRLAQRHQPLDHGLAPEARRLGVGVPARQAVLDELLDDGDVPHGVGAAALARQALGQLQPLQLPVVLVEQRVLAHPLGQHALRRKRQRRHEPLGQRHAARSPVLRAEPRLFPRLSQRRHQPNAIACACAIDAADMMGEGDGEGEVGWPHWPRRGARGSRTSGSPQSQQPPPLRMIL